MRVLSIVQLDASSASTPPGPREIEAMNKFIEELRGSGALIDTGGRDPSMLELVIARKNGTTTVTDGPFTEAKEVVGGYALLDVKDRDDAVALTNRFLQIIGEGTCHLHEVSIG